MDPSEVFGAFFDLRLAVSDTPPCFLNLDAPTLGAESVKVDGVVMWRVWRKHCQEWHYHGPGEGHWEAHCANPNSPYRTSGYNLANPYAIDGDSESMLEFLRYIFNADRP